MYLFAYIFTFHTSIFFFFFFFEFVLVRFSSYRNYFYLYRKIIYILCIIETCFIYFCPVNYRVYDVNKYI